MWAAGLSWPPTTVCGVNMKIQVVSDLHIEFYPRSMVLDIIKTIPQMADVLVVSGDTVPAYNTKRLSDVMSALSDRHKHIVYVLGNHDFYTPDGTDLTPDKIANGAHNTALKFKNIHVLEDGHMTFIDGKLFVGCTLWFSKAPGYEGDADNLSDFKCIPDFDPWVFEQNTRQQEWLKKTVRRGDIVVTHHMPSFESVHPRFITSRLNKFFVCDMHSFIEERQPALWVHGHTHESFDYRIGQTRVVCNPAGYPYSFEGRLENGRFNEQLVVEIP